MLISHSHRFIFFHVAKVAGLSIRQALMPYITEPEKFKIRRPIKFINGQLNPLYVLWDSALTHATALDTQKEYGELFNHYFKFAFVRNPWDWQVSMYHFILKEPEHIYHQHVKAMSGFDEYINWVIATRKPFTKGATKFQHQMLCDQQGKILVDFIGRYENLNSDFAYLCQQLNLTTQMPYLNQSQHRQYTDYYHQATRELIAEHFSEDIRLFGYEFDSYHNTAPYLQRHG
ncbi:MAG: hypothetical protein RL637_1849 [Pseudomonadota bacterium]|jgi:hypothetical protein